MSVLGLEPVFLQPAFPLVGFFVTLQSQLLPLLAAVIDVGVTAVRADLHFAAKRLQRFDQFVTLVAFGMGRLPFFQSIRDQFLRGRAWLSSVNQHAAHRDRCDESRDCKYPYFQH